MPTESELRALLQGEPDAAPRLDAARIIRRARARRLPRQLAVGSLSGLAALAIVVPVALGGGLGGSAADDSAGGGATARYDAPEGAAALADGEAMASKADAAVALACGAVLPMPVPDPSGLVLATRTEATGSEATVSLTNTGASPVTGTVTSFVLAAVRGETVVASGATTAAIPMELAPGASAVLPLGVVPAGCGADAAESVSDAPLVAAISFTPADGSETRLILASPAP